MTISTDGQLTEHIKGLNSGCDIINREISAIGAKTQVGKEEVRVKLVRVKCQLSCMGWKPGKSCQKQKF